MRTLLNSLFVAPSPIRPVFAGVLALAATATVGTRAFAQTAAPTLAAASVTASSDSADGTERRDDKRKQIGYAAGAALGLGIALMGGDGARGSASGAPGSSGIDAGLGTSTAATRTAPGGTDFTPDDNGTVLVTGDSAGTPSPGSTSEAGFSGGTGTTESIANTEIAFFGSGESSGSASAAPSDFLASTPRSLALSTPTANPEPGEWLAMGMMGGSVLGLMLRARRRPR